MWKRFKEKKPEPLQDVIFRNRWDCYNIGYMTLHGTVLLSCGFYGEEKELNMREESDIVEWTELPE